ncbi:MAG: DUF3105 domain-containing protein [Sulfobacillus sp.]
MYQRVKPMKPKRVHKKPSRVLLWVSGVVIAALVAVAVLVAISLQPTPTATQSVSYKAVSAPVATSMGIHEPVSPPAATTTQAVAAFKYLTNPPTSGAYSASAWPTAFNDPTQMPTAVLVHLLALGNVVIAYGPIAPQQIASMQSFALSVDQGLSASVRAKAGEGIFVTPWASLQPGQVALLAWGRLWQSTDFNQANATLFADTFLGNHQNTAQK